MLPATPLLSNLPIYPTILTRAEELRNTSIAALFETDEQRVHTMTASAAGLRLDFSKQLIDREALALLLKLAEAANLDQAVDALFRGEPVNNTEKRPALHMLLRGAAIEQHPQKAAEVEACTSRMRVLTQQIIGGERTGFDGGAFTDVVNIGIGGSDLGPRLATEALVPCHNAMRTHYVANVDPSDLHATLRGLNPQTTLFVVCSKSFTTEETLANATSARAWLQRAAPDSARLNDHFIAVTTNIGAAESFGISATDCLPMWDWVGGRYSVWSAVGISTAIAVGWENFTAFLGGAAEMDTHFATTPLQSNLPVLLSLLEVWNVSFLGAQNHVVLPYDHLLRHLPDYLQQLTMESNGKSVARDGTPLPYSSGPVLWGSAGTIGQHSFHQLLHQGTLLCPADFVVALTSPTAASEQHQKLVANCIAQSRTLLVGRSYDEARGDLLARGYSDSDAKALAQHLVMPGNRPNSVITMQRLTPAALGALLALYEHRTYCSATIWGINPFDQWGVELGKKISSTVLARMRGEATGDDALDASSEALLAQFSAAQDSAD